MGVLLVQLLKAGLLSEKRFREREAKEVLGEQQREHDQLARFALRKDVHIERALLDACESMHDFKRQAKEMLLRDPSQINVILIKAHRFKKHDGGRRFVWFFYQVRDRLKGLSAEERKQFLNKAFRTHGSVIS